MINPKIFPNYNDYIYSYCDAKDMGGHLNVKGASRCEELQTILKEFVMVRRTKDDVEHALPPKTRHMMILDSKKVDTQMHELKEAQKRFEGGKPKDFKDNLMEFYRFTAIAKASAVTSYLENEYITKDGVKDKLIIFGHHQVVLDTIGRMLENKVTGIISTFVLNPSFRVLDTLELMDRPRIEKILLSNSRKRKIVKLRC